MSTEGRFLTICFYPMVINKIIVLCRYDHSDASNDEERGQRRKPSWERRSFNKSAQQNSVEEKSSGKYHAILLYKSRLLLIWCHVWCISCHTVQV